MVRPNQVSMVMFTSSSGLALGDRAAHVPGEDVLVADEHGDGVPARISGAVEPPGIMRPELGDRSYSEGKSRRRG